MTTIPVGPELDRAVGEAMGAIPKWKARSSDGSEEGPFPNRFAANLRIGLKPKGDVSNWETTPVYPTYSMDNAGPVLEWLANVEHADPSLEYERVDLLWTCYVYRKGHRYTGEGATWQEAVCRATLALKGVSDGAEET